MFIISIHKNFFLILKKKKEIERISLFYLKKIRIKKMKKKK